MSSSVLGDARNYVLKPFGEFVYWSATARHEFVDAVKAVWASAAQDGRYAHHGEFFQPEGSTAVELSQQCSPVIFHAGGSQRGGAPRSCQVPVQLPLTVTFRNRQKSP